VSDDFVEAAKRIEETEPSGVPAHDPRIVFVFAGSYSEAERWRTLHTTLPPSRVKWVRDGQVLRGYRNQRAVIFGSFWERRDAADLLELAKIFEHEWVD